MTLENLTEYVQEHAPPDFADPTNWPLLALALVYFFMLAGVREKPRVVWLLPLFWLFEACGESRAARWRELSPGSSHRVKSLAGGLHPLAELCGSNPPKVQLIEFAGRNHKNANRTYSSNTGPV